MVIRKYLCIKCGDKEIAQSIRDEPLDRCPDCGKRINVLPSAGIDFGMSLHRRDTMHRQLNAFMHDTHEVFDEKRYARQGVT